MTRWPRRVTTLLATVVAVVTAVLGLLWLFQRSLVYQPDTSVVVAPSDVREVELSTADGLQLGAWIVEPDASSDRATAVLYAPGNAGNRAGRLDTARLLADEGFTVLLLDYRGYGGNPGRPSEDGLAADALAASDLLAAEGFGPNRILYLGESIGTGVVSRLLVERPPAGLLLRSPFTDFAAVANHHLPWLPTGALLRDRFPLLDDLAGSPVPVSVVWGTADTVVPAQQSAEVARASENLVEEVVLDGVGHNDPPMFGTPLVAATVRLADQVVP